MKHSRFNSENKSQTNLLKYLFEFLDSSKPFELAISMTLVLILLYSGDFWYLRVPLTIIIATAIILQPLRYDNNLWFLITVFLVAANYHNWYLIDNHKYLITYWSFTIYLASISTKPNIVIQKSARLLIGLTFLFATLWKVISPDFMSGTFFHFTLLLDKRFTDISLYLGKLSKQSLIYNKLAFDVLVRHDGITRSIVLMSTNNIRFIAGFITWWSILIEGLVAISFLWKRDYFISKCRDILLLTFILTTYCIAPVIGFGTVLVIMGITQCNTNSKYTRLLYIFTFFILQIYSMPWNSIITFFLSS